MAHVSLPKPLGSGEEVSEWFTRFEICSRANGWDEVQRVLKLPTLLEGEALAAWLECSEEIRGVYESAKKEITKKLCPPEFVLLEQFQQRKWRPAEPISLFVQDLKRLLGQALPDLDGPAREKLTVHQFVTGLPPAVSRQLRATDEANTMEIAMERAQRLMVFTEEGRVEGVEAYEQDMQQLKNQITSLSEPVAALTPPSKSIRCFICNQMGHMRRNCPQRARQARRCFSCGRLGHIARNCNQGNEQGAMGQAYRRPRQQ